MQFTRLSLTISVPNLSLDDLHRAVEQVNPGIGAIDVKDIMTAIFDGSTEIDHTVVGYSASTVYMEGGEYDNR